MLLLLTGRAKFLKNRRERFFSSPRSEYYTFFRRGSSRWSYSPAKNNFLSCNGSRYILRMRITSGMLGGRTFKVPKAGVRPTKEQVREAIFSSLGARMSGARVLDLFAGGGSLALEAWSRGAASVTAVERDCAVCKMLDANFETLNAPELGEARAVCDDVYRFLPRAQAAFDLVFADPPYDEADLPKLLAAAGNALAEGGIIVFEMRASDAYTLPVSWVLIKEKTYGETRILFLERKT